MSVVGRHGWGRVSSLSPLQVIRAGQESGVDVWATAGMPLAVGDRVLLLDMGGALIVLQPLVPADTYAPAVEPAPLDAYTVLAVGSSVHKTTTYGDEGVDEVIDGSPAFGEPVVIALPGGGVLVAATIKLPTATYGTGAGGWAYRAISVKLYDGAPSEVDSALLSSATDLRADVVLRGGYAEGDTIYLMSGFADAGHLWALSASGGAISVVSHRDHSSADELSAWVSFGQGRRTAYIPERNCTIAFSPYRIASFRQGGLVSSINRSTASLWGSSGVTPDSDGVTFAADASSGYRLMRIPVAEDATLGTPVEVQSVPISDGPGHYFGLVAGGVRVGSSYLPALSMEWDDGESYFELFDSMGVSAGYGLTTSEYGLRYTYGDLYGWVAESRTATGYVAHVLMDEYGDAPAAVSNLSLLEVQVSAGSHSVRIDRLAESLRPGTEPIGTEGVSSSSYGGRTFVATCVNRAEDVGADLVRVTNSLLLWARSTP